MPRNLTILGSTGSIGTQTLDVVRDMNSRAESAASPHYRIRALSCGGNIDKIIEQAEEFSPEALCIGCEKDAEALKEAIKKRLPGRKIEILCGEKGMEEIAGAEDDMILTAVVGMRGLKPTLRAIEAGSDVALANKETLVAGGDVVMRRAAEKHVSIIPVDSEHSAIFQCLMASGKGGADAVEQLILTASGGPFRTLSDEELKNVTLAEALNHPTWKMGGKITVDCATMMNKGLEVIEAMHLFNVPVNRITVNVHPESIVHSMVRFRDGSVMAQLGLPDMKVPIRLALTYPYRGVSDTKRLDLTEIGRLTFEKPQERFRCLSTAYFAAAAGGTAPAAMNGANEAAVELFMKGKIGFNDIAALVENALDEHIKTGFCAKPELEQIFEADGAARKFVYGKIR